MTRILLATGNAHKVVELRAVLAEAGLDLEVLGLRDVAPGPEPVEDAKSYEGNALIKARTWCERTGLVCLADDSGLGVDILNGCPGVRSSRWAGPECDDDANLRLVLRQIDDVPDQDRGATFVCALALVLPDGTERVLRREWRGRITHEARGANGFGYDPIFQPDGSDATSAELSPEEKNAISHRGQALRAMAQVLRELVVGGGSASAGAGSETWGGRA